LPFQKAVAIIKAQDAGRDFPNFCKRFDDNSIKLKVIGPIVGARVKKPGKLTSFPYDRPNVTALLAITKSTSIRQVFSGSRAAMFHADDVIDLASKVSVILVNETIFVIRTETQRAWQPIPEGRC
jgi:hypothetical protein